MKIQISPASNVVTIDGEARKIDCSALNQAVLSMQFDTLKNQGVEHLANCEINVLTSLAEYQPVIDAWNAWQVAQPPAPEVVPAAPVV